MDAKATDSFETSQLITLAVCCGYVSNLIGRRTINIPEIILGVHGSMGFTVKILGWVTLRWTSIQEPKNQGISAKMLCRLHRKQGSIFVPSYTLTICINCPEVHPDDFCFFPEVKLYVIAIPCALGVLLVGFLLGAIVLLRRRRSSSGATHPRMQMSLLKDTIHMSDADPPNAASLPVYRPTTQKIKT